MHTGKVSPLPRISPLPRTSPMPKTSPEIKRKADAQSSPDTIKDPNKTAPKKSKVLTNKTEETVAEYLQEEAHVENDGQALSNVLTLKVHHEPLEYFKDASKNISRKVTYVRVNSSLMRSKAILQAPEDPNVNETEKDAARITGRGGMKVK